VILERRKAATASTSIWQTDSTRPSVRRPFASTCKPAGIQQGLRQELWFMSDEDNTDVEETVLQMIARKKHIDRSLVNLDSSFEELAIDSLNAISLMFAFEEMFQIDLSDTVVTELKTVRDLTKQVKQLLDAK
jgi:acyl carrier protein